MECSCGQNVILKFPLGFRGSNPKLLDPPTVNFDTSLVSRGNFSILRWMDIYIIFTLSPYSCTCSYNTIMVLLCYGTVLLWYFMSDSRVPSRYFLRDGTVPSRYFLCDGTVPSRYFLQDGTVPSPNHYLLNEQPLINRVALYWFSSLSVFSFSLNIIKRL